VNTANLQLEGMVMAVAALCQALAEKQLLSHEAIDAALAQAKDAVEGDDSHRLSEANQNAILFPIHLLRLANQAHERGERFTFADYAAQIGRLT
jgi:hypothetical protein